MEVNELWHNKVKVCDMNYNQDPLSVDHYHLTVPSRTAISVDMITAAVPGQEENPQHANIGIILHASV